VKKKEEMKEEKSKGERGIEKRGAGVKRRRTGVGADGSGEETREKKNGKRTM